MAYEIQSQLCTGCGSCADACPQQAISAAPDGSVYRINANECVDCGACETSCPNEAPRALA